MTATPPAEPPEPQTTEDIRTLEEIKWAPRGCEAVILAEEIHDCGKTARYRFKTLSPYQKTSTQYACSTEHALASAQGLWEIGHVIQ